MKNKKVVIIIAIIAFLIAAAIALFALLNGVFSSKSTTNTANVASTAVVASTATSSSVAPASSSMAESSATTSESASESTSAASGDEKSSTVTFTFFVHGESIGSFDVPNAVGKTVFEAMESNTEIKFNFNQEEGVIDNIFDNPNDGVNTWVYLLNHQVADAGTKTQVLKAGDSIQWYFGTIDEIPTTIIPAEESSSSAQ